MGTKKISHVLHVVRDINIASGGPSRSVTLLSERLESEGIRSSILFTDSSSPKVPAERSKLLGLEKAGRFDVIHAIDELQHEDPISIVHSHGCWTLINHHAVAKAREIGVPYVISPRGMLEPWSMSQKSLKKKLGWWLYQRKDLSKAAGVHATGYMERDNLLRLGVQSKIAVVPNGIEAPPELFENDISKREKTMLFLSRIHPKKGLMMLVEAWDLVRPAGWNLKIIGPNENQHAEKIQAAIDSCGLQEEISIYDAVDGDQRWQEYRNASVFILPTFSENFGNVVGEALACRMPVITTTGTPWNELETEKCGWWVEPNVASISNSIRTASSLSSDELTAMGIAGERLFARKYRWSTVAKNMLEFYGATL